MTAEPPIRLRVMLVDDHEIVRSGIKAMLAATDDLRVVAEAESVGRGDRARRSGPDPDVVVMDIRLVDGSGIEATREIRARLPETQVLMLTSFADDEALYASIMAGAAGYVLKQIQGGDLVRGIRTRRRRPEPARPGRDAAACWTACAGASTCRTRSWRCSRRRRRRSWPWWPRARPTARSARELFLAEKTVKNYVSSILGKLEVARRSEAAAYLARHTSTPGA